MRFLKRANVSRRRGKTLPRRSLLHSRCAKSPHAQREQAQPRCMPVYRPTRGSKPQPPRSLECPHSRAAWCSTPAVPGRRAGVWRGGQSRVVCPVTGWVERSGDERVSGMVRGATATQGGREKGANGGAGWGGREEYERDGRGGQPPHGHTNTGGWQGRAAHRGAGAGASAAQRRVQAGASESRAARLAAPAGRPRATRQPRR